MTRLTTQRLILRKPIASDLEPFTAFATSDRAGFVGGGADKDEGHAFRMLGAITGHWELRGYGLFIACERESGRPVASVGPWCPAGWPEPEIGWSVWDERDEGKGYACEAAEAVIAHVFRDLGWTTTVSYIDPDNARSIALAERLGAAPDPGAARPHKGDLVYRHPAPAPRADADTARADTLLAGHRASIDRLDAILIYTLGERFKHTQDVGRLKAEHALPPSDPAREAAQIARLEDLAKRADLDPAFARKFLSFVIAEVIQHHKQISGET